jgi:hypothetical protein
MPQKFEKFGALTSVQNKIARNTQPKTNNSHVHAADELLNHARENEKTLLFSVHTTTTSNQT